MPLYEVAIVSKENDKEVLMFGPKAIIAKSEDAARNRAIMIMVSLGDFDIAEGVADSSKTENMEILCRPFE